MDSWTFGWTLALIGAIGTMVVLRKIRQPRKVSHSYGIHPRRRTARALSGHPESKLRPCDHADRRLSAALPGYCKGIRAPPFGAHWVRRYSRQYSAGGYDG